MIFQTERCHIRKLKSTDFDGLYELHSDKDVMQYTSGDAQNEAECAADLDHVISQYEKTPPTLLVYAIINEQNEFIGTCALLWESDKELEIGYRLCKRFWGKGYATEVTIGLLTYCKSTFNNNEIFAYCYVLNQGSIRVLEKCRFLLKEEFVNKDDGLLDRKYSIKLG